MSEAPPEVAGLLKLDDVAEQAQLRDADEEGLAPLRALGRDLTNFLFQSLRTLAMHREDNAAVREPLTRLRGTLEALGAHVQRVHFITVEGQVYLNDLRIRMEASAYGNLQYLLGILQRHGIGGITWQKPPSEADLKALALMLLKHRTEPGTDPLTGVRRALDIADIPDVEFDQPYFFKSGEGGGGDAIERHGQEVAAVSYAKGVLAVKDYFRAVEAAEAANPLRIRKIVHDLVDVAEDNPEDFLKLHVIHWIEDPYYNHCVNVATLAVAIGRQLGLDRVELADLGAAAMFHDLGYAAVKRQATTESHEYSDRDLMRLHPVVGFKSLLRQGEYGPGLLRRLLVTLEHHMHWQRPGGYPNLGKKSLSVFTRIVQVADHYDALVTPSGESSGLLPVKALERIVAGAGSAFDPVAVKAFVQVVGRYPYGSLVRLSSGELGVVASGGRDERSFMKPVVMVVRSGSGAEIEPHAVDLAQRDVLRRRIVEVLDPYDVNVMPHTVLFGGLEAEEEPEAEAPPAASFAADAWNAAVWAGEDAEQVMTKTLSGSELPAITDADVDAARPFEPTPAPPSPSAAATVAPSPASTASFLPLWDEEDTVPYEEVRVLGAVARRDGAPPEGPTAPRITPAPPPVPWPSDADTPGMSFEDAGAETAQMMPALSQDLPAAFGPGDDDDPPPDTIVIEPTLPDVEPSVPPLEKPPEPLIPPPLPARQRFDPSAARQAMQAALAEAFTRGGESAVRQLMSDTYSGGVPAVTDHEIERKGRG